MKKIRLYDVTAVGSMLVVAIIVLGLGLAFWNRNAVSFKMFFSESTLPQSFRLVASGKHRPIPRGGLYVLVFTIPRDELRALAESNRFVMVNPNHDPEPEREWLSSCNRIIRSLVATNITISPKFEAYFKGHKGPLINTNSASLFYDTNQELAVVIGRGTFLRPGSPLRY
jgi:hypothetical protein